MEEKKKASVAHMKATKKYEDLNYDKVLVRFPIGTKERIEKATKENGTTNKYIQQAVFEKLTRDGIDELSSDELQKIKANAEKKYKERESAKEEKKANDNQITE